MYSKKDRWLEYVVCAKTEDPFPIQVVLYYKDFVVTLSMFFHPLQMVMVFDFDLTTVSGSQQPYSIPK
jgi:hypothetical protein